VKLEGRVAIVTGGGGAIGGAQCEAFAREGAAVCVADLFLDKAEAVAGRIEAGGGRAIGCALDVRVAEQWATAVAACEAAFGPVAILCNNAGANVRVSFDEQTEEMWRMIVDTILTGSFLGTKAVVPSMRRAGGGVIVNLGSLASVRAGGGSPAYGAAKTALVALTRSTASSYAREGIRCILISPGHVDTPFIRVDASYSPNDAATSIDNPVNYQRRVQATPLGRLVTPDDVARSALFVVSDEAAMLTGSNLLVDGGAAL
jgi:NAD(P)-dependent dehydrogenase (short-subunit alcohol dehydrogenase family)